MTVRRPAATLIVALLLTACGPAGSVPSTPSGSAPGPTSASPTASPASVVLSVFGAASLKGVLDAVKPAYEGAHPGITIESSTDSSTALRTQIEQGASADIFLSADVANPQKLADAGLTGGKPISFATNSLTIVVPTANPGKINAPADLARPGLRIIAAGPEVPITKYVTQSLKLMAGLPGFPPSFGAAYDANVVSREDNVKALVAKIELGEGDAGIVYQTDAIASTKIKTVGIPSQANVLATYAAVSIKASSHQAAARQVLAWLVGADGQAILAGFGFRPPAS